MNTYRDLTYYSFQHFENSKNIGWINENHQKTRDKNNITNEFLMNLCQYIKYPINTIRGIDDIKSITYNNYEYKLGFSEIRVLSQDGKQIFAAPDLIMYHMVNNGYNPPQDFVNAVMYGPKPYSQIYTQYIKRYNAECLWGESEEYVELSKKLTRYIWENNEKNLINEITENPEIINIVNINGSLLNTALKYKKTSLSKELIQLNIDINKFNGIELITAIENKEDEIVELLISKKIFIDQSSPKANPLFSAIRRGDINVVRLLLKSGVDKNLEYSNEFMKNFTAFDLARRCKQDEIHQELLDY